MKQTAVEWLIEQLIPEDQHEGIMDIIEDAKEMQNQQMIKFAEYVATYPDKNRNVNDEMLHAKSKYDGAERTIDLLEQYYNETYGSKGSDEHIEHNLDEIVTSSQTEISDEEIEKQADKYSDAYDCPSKIKLCKHDIKAAFVNSIGWYREQLKK